MPPRYNTSMRRLLVPFLFLTLLSLALPFEAQADMPLFDPTWHLVPDAHELDADCSPGAPLGFAGVLQLIQNLMNAGISIGILICVLVIAFAGMLFILTPANPENHSMARQMLTNAAVGLLIILSAWIVVDFVMKVLYQGESGQEGKFGPWNEILTGGDYCVKAQTGVQSLFNQAIAELPYTPPGTGGAAGGTCSVPSSQANPCSVTNMQQQCFAARATDASRICMLESAGGQAAIKSGSDKLDGGTGPSYSIGLWQINLTVHKVDGLNCPAAFTKPCGQGYGTLVGPSKPGACNSSLKTDKASQDLYAKCVLAAQDPAKNTTVACSLYKSAGGFQPWTYSANRCSVSLK